MTAEPAAEASAQRSRRSRGPSLLENLSSFGLSPDGRGIRFWELLSVCGFLGGMGAIAIYAWPEGVVFAILALVASAAWLSGGVLGFLFGVPRLRAAQLQNGQTPTTDGYSPNTNLEQISDWLTKIIVGATLVQLRPLVENISSLAAAIGAQLGTPGGTAVGGAVMVTYFAGGFMWGYLWCSLRVFKEMSNLVGRERAVSQREGAPPRS